ncbi:shikimate kinase [Streptomyces sp. NPDC007157]|uniref:shikimate kinase n=1 Tax=Streptomyces sp. NPDC007157 TaxID=3154681 RepID=UPI0033F816EC
MSRSTRIEAPWMVLVGPSGTGKTTLGRELAARTRRPFVDLDATADGYCAEAGWIIARLRERIAVVGRVAAEAEWEPARAHAVARAVAGHPDAVIALGAGHTSYTDHRHLVTVRTALKGRFVPAGVFEKLTGWSPFGTALTRGGALLTG